jgi:hypothetical protein
MKDKSHYYNILNKSYELFNNIINTDKSYYIGRIGGIEWDLVNIIYNNNNNIIMNNINKSHIFDYAGYYDLTNNKETNFKKYYDLYIESLKYCSFMTVGNNKENINFGLSYKSVRKPHKLFDSLNIKCCTYWFIANTWSKHGFLFKCGPMFKNKKVLLISPFGDIMKKQYDTKKDLLYNQPHPLQVKSLDYVNTYITINNNKYNANLIHSSFIETLEILKNEIKNKDFDVAFISCGAYATPLGLYICKELNKQAIYIGGVLQLFFGINGRRYSKNNRNNLNNKGINPNQYWINPPTSLLCDELKNKVGKGHLESIGAYF